MKKLLLLIVSVFCLLQMISPKIAFANDIDNSIYVVTANRATIFEAPDFCSTQIKSMKHKTEVQLELENEIPKIYLSSEFGFYKILQYEGIDGYIFSDLVVPKANVITAIPNFNAKTNKSCKVLFLEDNIYVESEISLEKNSNIFLYEGFNGKKQYTAISFVHENEVLYGYLETKNISPNGINPAIIYSLIIIIALLGIIFAWIFMKNKKIKIKKKSPKKEN